MAGLAQRCGVQAAQLSLLSGVADALTRKANIDAALARRARGHAGCGRHLQGRAHPARSRPAGWSCARTSAFRTRSDRGFAGFFGHAALLDDIVAARGERLRSVSRPCPTSAARDILTGANVASVQIVPLISDGRGMGAMIIGATQHRRDQRRLGRVCASDGEPGGAVAGARAIRGASDRVGAAVPDVAGERQRLHRRAHARRHRSRDESSVGRVHRPAARAADRTAHRASSRRPGKEDENVQMLQRRDRDRTRRTTPPVEIAAPNGSESADGVLAHLRRRRRRAAGVHDWPGRHAAARCSRNSCASRRSWRRSASSPAASRTTSTTC